MFIKLTSHTINIISKIYKNERKINVKRGILFIPPPPPFKYNESCSSMLTLRLFSYDLYNNILDYTYKYIFE